MRGSHGMRLLVKYGDKLLWSKSIVDESLHHQLRIQKFEVVKTWLPRIVRALSESPLLDHMPTNALVEIAFDTDLKNNKSDTPVSDVFDLTMQEIIDLPLDIEIEALDASSIRLNVPSSFDKKSFLKENIAEVILVEAFIKGLVLLSRQKLNDTELQKLISNIVPNEQARQAHTFLVSNFRQSMVDIIQKKMGLKSKARVNAAHS